MPDFGDGEWSGMLCIEAGNMLESAVTLEPGASRTVRYRLAVEGT
jgi:glucose-6-phosphate 1-epimerase